jgi:hypothetical protein
MHDIRIFESAHDMDYRLDGADVTEEFVAQTFAFAGAFDKACDVAEFYSRVDSLF